MAIIKVITPSVTDANITTAKVTDNAITLAKMASGTDGNIISYDASGNPVAIATGSDGQVLTSTGAGSPPAFEAAAAGGKVLQVVTNVVSSVAVNSGTTYVDVISKAITPASTSNKILVMLSCDLKIYGGANHKVLYKTLRGSTEIESGTAIEDRHDGASYQTLSAGFQQIILDSPSSSSAVTYKIQMNENSSQEAEPANIHLTLMEIAG